MTPNKDTYKNRDMLLGRIDERTSHIPKMRDDINKLGKEIAIIKVKSGLWGTLGGAIAVGLYYLKDLFIYGRHH